MKATLKTTLLSIGILLVSTGAVILSSEMWLQGLAMVGSGVAVLGLREWCKEDVSVDG